MKPGGPPPRPPSPRARPRGTAACGRSGEWSGRAVASSHLRRFQFRVPGCNSSAPREAQRVATRACMYGGLRWTATPLRDVAITERGPLFSRPPHTCSANEIPNSSLQFQVTGFAHREAGGRPTERGLTHSLRDLEDFEGAGVPNSSLQFQVTGFAHREGGVIERSRSGTWRILRVLGFQIPVYNSKLQALRTRREGGPGT